MKMPLALLVALVALFPTLVNAGDDTVKTHVKNGGNNAVIVQSGSPKSAQVTVEQRPGYTRIEQHSQHNSATVIQMDGNGAGAQR